MAKDFDNTNRFTLFKNDVEEGSKRPNYSGTINVDGKDYEISGWIKEGRKGKFISGTVKPPFNKTAKQAAPQSSYDEPGEDEIPF